MIGSIRRLVAGNVGHRCGVACAVLASIAGATAFPGCASNASRDWAQTSPVIPPSADGRPMVIGASFEAES